MKYLAVLLAVLFGGCAAYASCLTEHEGCGNTETPCCAGLVCIRDTASTTKHCAPGTTTTTTTLPTSCGVAGTNCSADQHVICCSGLQCKQFAGQNIPTCQPFGQTTTTIVTQTTTTTASGTTSTTGSPTTTTSLPIPPHPEFSALLTPSDIGSLLTRYGESCQFAGDIVDPRDGLPANQLVLTTLGWELEEYSMEMVAMADAVGCPFNDQQIEDANFKFGADYVLDHQAFPSGGTYQWMQPTYVRQYTCAPALETAGCLAAHHALPPELAQVAGIGVGPTSPPPATIDPNVQDGLQTYTPNHYPPLTRTQCDALAASEAAHMAHDEAFLRHDFAGAAANNQAVLDTQRAFEATATTLDQAQLFKWTWQGNYNMGNPQDVLDGLTQKIIDAHHGATLSFNCDFGSSPNVGAIYHYRFLHNFLHDCRATTHWLDIPKQTVCETTQIQSCPRLTCRQEALQ